MAFKKQDKECILAAVKASGLSPYRIKRLFTMVSPAGIERWLLAEQNIKQGEN